MRGNAEALPADESAWFFQARIFASGSLTTTALPDTASDALINCSERFFEYNIFHRNRWFSTYPPAWPAVLAVGHLLHAGWLVNPLLGLLLLWLMTRMGGLLLNSSGPAVAMLAVLSPYFVFNCVGYLSHTCCAVLIAGAMWCLFRLQTPPKSSGTLWTAMFAMIGAAFLVRPGTGLAAGLVLTAAGAWLVYRKRDELPRFLASAILCGAVTLSLYAAYNLSTSGSLFEAPYNLFGRLYCYRLTVTNLREWINSFIIARWALQATQVFTIPLLFPLAAYAVWAAVTRGLYRFQTFVCAGMYLAIAGIHMIVPIGSSSGWGERYYFEGFAALCLLAVTGWLQLKSQWKVTAGSAALLGASIVVLQAFHFIVLVPPILEDIRPLGLVRELAAASGEKDIVIFLDPSGFTAKHMNMNEAEWWNAPKLYLVDPGVERRAHVTNAMRRSRYAVLSYDQDAKAARMSTVTTPGASEIATSSASAGVLRETLRCNCGGN